MRFTKAIARKPGNDVAGGLTTATLGPPSIEKTIAQHDAYVAALRNCGLTVTVLDPLDGYPDAHFVEDTAIVTPEVAVITHPGAVSRRGEVPSIREALAAERDVVTVAPPGTIDGGDVLMIGRHFLIGISDRTNANGAEQLAGFLSPYGYRCTTVPVGEGLHLKSSVNAVGHDIVLTTQAFSGHPALAGYRCVIIPENEAYAGNTLRINDRILTPAGYPQTRKLLEKLDLPIIELDTSEFRKMDGGLTCLSLRF